jgi:hypothetical protein
VHACAVHGGPADLSRAVLVDICRRHYEAARGMRAGGLAWHGMAWRAHAAVQYGKTMLVPQGTMRRASGDLRPTTARYAGRYFFFGCLGSGPRQGRA